MKLHLPKGLRAALLAVVTASAALTTTVQAAAEYKADACTYTEQKYYLEENWASYEEGTVTSLTQLGGRSEGIRLQEMENVNKRDWILSIDAYNVLPLNLTDENPGCVFLYGTAEATIDEDGKVSLGSPNAMSIFITPTGRIMLAATGDTVEKLVTKEIGFLDRDWDEDNEDPAVSLRLILKWDADGGLTNFEEGGRYGSLTMVGIKELSNEADHAIIGDVKSFVNNGSEIMENLELPKHLFGKGQDVPATSHMYSGQVKFTLYHLGDDRTDKWAPNATWRVTGRTSINDLVDGGTYVDEVLTTDSPTATKRELGHRTYVNLPDKTDTKYVADTITFTGTQGALVLTETANTKLSTLDGNAVHSVYKEYTGAAHEEIVRYENEFQLSNYYEIGYQIDPESATPEVVAGFGAEENLSMRVDIGVMENTALADSACGLSIVGKGTTILEIDNTGMKRLGALGGELFREDLHYDINSGKAFTDVLDDYKDQLAAIGINRAGLRIEAVNVNGQLVGHFAVDDSASECFITFAATEDSNIILSPKGRGHINLNLHSSDIHSQSHITLVDEAAEKVTEVRDVTVNVKRPNFTWGSATDITLPAGSPYFDTNGNPIYRAYTIDENGQKQDFNINTGEYTNEDFTKADSPKLIFDYQKDQSGADVPWTEEDWDETWTNEEKEGNYRLYKVLKGDGSVAFIIKLTHKPVETDLLEAVPTGPDNIVTPVNGAYQTKVVTKVLKDQEVEVWRSWNEHNAIEKSVAEKYTAVNAVAHQITNTGNSTDDGVLLKLNLYTSVDEEGRICKTGFVENTTSRGQFIVNGRKDIKGKDDGDNPKTVGGILSTLYASGLKSAYTMEIDGNVIVDGDIESADRLDINSGFTHAKNVTVKSGSLHVGIQRLTIDEFDPHTATLMVDGVLTLVRQEPEVDEETPGDEIVPPEGEGGTEDTPVVQGAAPQLYISGGASIRHLKADNRVYLGTDSLGSYATPEAWLSVETAETPEIRATWINLRSNMQDEDILAEGTPTLVSGWTHFYNDKAATVEGSDFHKTVLGYTPTSYSGNRIMYSEHVNNNTVIDLIDDDVTLIVKEMDGSDVVLGDSLNGTAPLLASNLGHQVGENEEKLMVVTYTGTTAEGKLTATDFYMPEGYSIRAAELHVAGTLMATASTEASTFALTRAVPGADTEFTNVQMKDAVITATGTSASSITADSISLGTGHVLSDATISTTDGLVAGNNTWLINITLADGDLTTYDDVVIYNMSMTGGKFMTEGDVSFNNVSLASMQAFGGSDGKAFTPAGGDKAEITFDGDLTKTGDDAFTLSLTNVTIDAAGHDFGKDAVVEVLKANDGSKISIDDLKSISFEVQPYTYASYDITEDGQLYLIGDKNEAKAKAELVNGSENRQKTMDAFEEALKSTPGGELAALRDAMGMVMKTSTEARREILDSISGASITALADSQRRGVQNVQNSLRNRIIQMGGNADWENAGIQAWAQADGSFSTTKSSEDAPGYDYTTWGATVGANIDLAETVTAGMSFSASYGEIKSDHADKATGDNNAYYVNLFARHQAGRWTQMLILTAGQNDMTLERTVGSYTAEGDTSGSSFSAYYEVGYTLGLNEEFTHILQPIVSARITSAKVDGYDEKGSIGNAALSYDGGSYTYGSVSAGLRYQGVLYESVFERNCVLEARAMVVSDFGDTTDTAKVALGQNTMREVKGVDTSGFGFDLGVGLSVPMEMQTTLFFDADLNVRPDYTGASANIGLRYDF